MKIKALLFSCTSWPVSAPYLKMLIETYRSLLLPFSIQTHASFLLIEVNLKLDFSFQILVSFRYLYLLVLGDHLFF